MKDIKEYINESLFDKDLIKRKPLDPEVICAELGYPPSCVNTIKSMLKDLYTQVKLKNLPSLNKLQGFMTDFQDSSWIKEENPKLLIGGELICVKFDCDWPNYFGWSPIDHDFEERDWMGEDDGTGSKYVSASYLLK